MTTEQDTFFFGLTIDTIDADTPIPVSTLRNTLDDLRQVLSDIEREVEGADRATIEWGWDGDPDLRIVASVNGVSASALQAIVGTALDGFDTAGTSSREEWPAMLTAHTRQTLARMVNRLSPIAAVTVTATDRLPVVIEPEQSAQSVDRPRFYTEQSAVDGELDVINVRGAPHFVIYEHLTGRRIRCALPDDLLPQVKEALQRRVIVSGLVRYRQDGSPVSVRQVTNLEEVRPPNFEIRSLRGSLPDIAGETPSGEYVRRLREANGDG